MTRKLWNFLKSLLKKDFSRNKKDLYSLEDISNIRQLYLSGKSRELLKENGFVVTPAYYKEISDVYLECIDTNQPIFITTDAVLHTGHIFFDYLLRILEVEKLYDSAVELSDRMLELSIEQFKEAHTENVKEAARLNIGFFAVAKRQFEPEYLVGYGLNELLKFYDKKYGKLASNLIHIQKSLVFLTYAEPDEMPHMLKELAWEEVKKFFEEEVRKIAGKFN